jgi:hypothetical protein
MRRLLLIAGFCIFGCLKSSAQDYITFRDLPGYDVMPFGTTYDSCLLLGAQNLETFKVPGYIMKMDKSGHIVLKIELSDFLLLTDVQPTSDSGFIAAVLVNRAPWKDPDDPDLSIEDGDSIFKAGLIKFNKCAEMQWCRFVDAPNYMITNNVIEDAVGNFYLYVYGINNKDVDLHKPNSILKFTPGGALLKSCSIEGVLPFLYSAPLKMVDNDIYVNQGFYLKKHPFDNLYYIYSGMSKFNTDLEVKGRKVFGYPDHVNHLGNFMQTGENEILVTRYDVDSTPLMKLTLYNRDLSYVVKNKEIGIKDHLALLPQGLLQIGDSIVSLCMVETDNQPYAKSTSIRLYNNELSELERADINYNNSLRPTTVAKFNDKLAVGVVDFSGDHAISKLYFYDHSLFSSNLDHSSSRSSNACTDTSNFFQKIDLYAVATPVKVDVDNSEADWTWFWYTGISKNTVEGTDFSIWPQPLKRSGILHISSNAFRSQNPYALLQANVLDLSGRVIYRGMLEFEAGSRRYLNTGAQLKQGAYILQIQNLNSGTILGSMPLIVNE